MIKLNRKYRDTSKWIDQLNVYEIKIVNFATGLILVLTHRRFHLFCLKLKRPIVSIPSKLFSQLSNFHNFTIPFKLHRTFYHTWTKKHCDVVVGYKKHANWYCVAAFLNLKLTSILRALQIFSKMRWAMWCKAKQKSILWYGIGSIIKWKFFSLPLQDVLIKRLHQKTFLAISLRNMKGHGDEWIPIMQINFYYRANAIARRWKWRDSDRDVSITVDGGAERDAAKQLLFVFVRLKPDSYSFWFAS